MLTRGKPVEVLAYAAGLFDGEGSICIQRYAVKPPHRLSPRYVARLSVAMTDQSVVRWFAAEFGGTVTSKNPIKETYRAAWSWEVTNVKACEFCETLLPYLRVKRPQAELLIRYFRGKAKWCGGDMTARRKPPEAELTFRDEMVRQMQALNGHPQRLSETASRTEEAIV